MDDIDRMVGRLAGALEPMTCEDVPIPGTLLDRVVSNGEEAADELVTFTRELLGVDDKVADRALVRFSEVLEFIAPTVQDIDGL